MYKEKYLKYKTKYLDLKNQLGGNSNIIQDGGRGRIMRALIGKSSSDLEKEAWARKKKEWETIINVNMTLPDKTEIQAEKKNKLQTDQEEQAKQELEITKWKQEGAQKASSTQIVLVSTSLQVVKKTQVAINTQIGINTQIAKMEASEEAEAQVAPLEELVAPLEELVAQVAQVAQEAQKAHTAQEAFVKQVQVTKEELQKKTKEAKIVAADADNILFIENKVLTDSSEELLNPSHIITEEEKKTFDAKKQALAKMEKEVEAAKKALVVLETLPLVENEALEAAEKANLTLEAAIQAAQASQKVLKTKAIEDILEAAQQLGTIIQLAGEALEAARAAQKVQEEVVAKVKKEVLDKEVVYLALQLESGNFLVKDYLRNSDDKLQLTHIINNPTTQFYQRNKIRNTSMPTLEYEENSFIVLKKLSNKLDNDTFLPVGLLINYDKKEEIYVIETRANQTYYFQHIDTFIDMAFNKDETEDKDKYNYLLDCFKRSIDFIKDNTNIKNKVSLINLIDRKYNRITSHTRINRTIPK
jgi:hypothetical protein